MLSAWRFLREGGKYYLSCDRTTAVDNMYMVQPCLKLQEAFSRVLRNPPLLFCSQSSVWFSFLSFISKASFSSMSFYCQSLTVFSPPKTFSPQKACFIEKNVAEEPLRENKELKKPSEAV